LKKISKQFPKKNSKINIPTHSKISVLLIAYGGSHQKIISAIADMLNAVNISFIIIAPPGSQEILKSTYDNVITFSEICQFPMIPVEYSGLFSEMLDSSALNTYLYKDSYFYLGNSLLDTIELIERGEYGEFFPDFKLPPVNSKNTFEIIRKLFFAQKRQFLLPLSTMGNIICKIDPDLVITTNSPRAERAAQISAYRLKVPCISVIDGFGTTEQYRINNVDNILVPNLIALENLVKRGCCKDKITITGNPVLEKIMDNDEKTAILYLKENNIEIDSFKKIILYPQSLSYFDFEAWKILNNVVEKMARLHEEYLFIVKIHPGDHCKAEFKSFNIIQLGEKVNINPFIHLSHLLLVSHSIAAIEGAVIGKPSLIFQTRETSPLQGLNIENFNFADTETQLCEFIQQPVTQYFVSEELLEKGFRENFLKIIQEYI